MSKIYEQALTPFEKEQKRRQDEREYREGVIADVIGGAAAERRSLVEQSAAKFDAAEAERQRAAEREALAAHEAGLRQQILSAYIAANGSEYGFELAWPQLRADFIRQQTLANAANAPAPETPVNAARRALALRYAKR